MEAQLFSIVYCSRNLLEGDRPQVKKELEDILASSRTNNARIDVTGALLYSAGNFAQVLEGPLAAVENTFETIQQDKRHSEVTVIQIGPIEERRFSEWSMAFAGNSLPEENPVATAAFDAVFRNAEGGKEQMLTLMQDLVVDGPDWVFPNSAGKT